ncbi:MAG: nucleotidyltransferase family protein [Sphingobacteriales bacterium]|nr:MAG: nucleotidyltransferase family protein [Sphingobacteriales bacterium]
MKAMVFAAGLGTRLKPFTDSHPKALALVHGKPLLEHTIRYLQKAGITEVVVNVHHFADQIEAVLQRENGFGSRVQVSDERDEVLETGGGLLKALPFLQDSDPVVVLNVDVLTNLNLPALLASHQHRSAAATLAVMRRSSSRYLLFDNDLRLCGWRNEKTSVEKLPRPIPELQPLAFSGIQVLSRHFLESVPLRGKFSMIDAYLHLANDVSIYGFDHTGDVFLDVGKPEAIAQAAGLLL